MNYQVDSVEDTHSLTDYNLEDTFWDDKGFVKPNDEQWQYICGRNIRIGRILENSIEEALKRLGVSYIRNRINGKGADFITTNTVNQSAIESKDTFLEYRVSGKDAKGKYDSRFLTTDPNGKMKKILVTPQYNATPSAAAILSTTTIIETHNQLTDDSTDEEIEDVIELITLQLSRVLLLSSSSCVKEYSFVEDGCFVSEIIFDYSYYQHNVYASLDSILSSFTNC